VSDDFSWFEHEGWKRVAERYDSVWASSKGQFIPPLLEAADVQSGMSVLWSGIEAEDTIAGAVRKGLFEESHREKFGKQCFFLPEPRAVWHSYSYYR
jgi:hypothetical protein